MIDWLFFNVKLSLFKYIHDGNTFINSQSCSSLKIAVAMGQWRKRGYNGYGRVILPCNKTSTTISNTLLSMRTCSSCLLRARSMEIHCRGTHHKGDVSVLYPPPAQFVPLSVESMFDFSILDSPLMFLVWTFFYMIAK